MIYIQIMTHTPHVDYDVHPIYTVHPTQCMAYIPHTDCDVHSTYRLIRTPIMTNQHIIVYTLGMF